MSYNIADAAASILKAIKGGIIVGAKAEPGEQRHHERHDIVSPDIEAEIEALIKQAGDRLRQQADDTQHEHDSGHEPASAHLLDDPRLHRPWWWRLVGYRRAH